MKENYDMQQLYNRLNSGESAHTILKEFTEKLGKAEKQAKEAKAKEKSLDVARNAALDALSDYLSIVIGTPLGTKEQAELEDAFRELEKKFSIFRNLDVSFKSSKLSKDDVEKLENLLKYAFTW